MTTSKAIERIQNIIERGNQINRGVHFMDKDLKALDKAIEVMGESVNDKLIEKHRKEFKPNCKFIDEILNEL